MHYQNCETWNHVVRNHMNINNLQTSQFPTSPTNLQLNEYQCATDEPVPKTPPADPEQQEKPGFIAWLSRTRNRSNIEPFLGGS